MALHIEQLFEAMNAVRAAVGWPALTWSAILPANVPAPAPLGAIRAVHLESVRAYLDQAYTAALGVSPPAYTTQAPLAGKAIKAIDFVQSQERAQ